jgi:hypothetical protein
MTDLLAPLDAAIVELSAMNVAPPVSGCRYEPQKSSLFPVVAVGEPGTETSKYLKYKANPVIPVNPCLKQQFEAEAARKNVSECENTATLAPYNISSQDGITGFTGKPQDFCGVERTRNANTEREFTGATGKSPDFCGFPATADPAHPPGDVPPIRWRQFIADSRAFLDSVFAEYAKALGWTDTDLFGCDEARPFARIDKMGLIWLLNGNRLVAITNDAAIYETKSGARLTFRRKPRCE